MFYQQYGSIMASRYMYLLLIFLFFLTKSVLRYVESKTKEEVITQVQHWDRGYMVWDEDGLEGEICW